MTSPSPADSAPRRPHPGLAALLGLALAWPTSAQAVPAGSAHGPGTYSDAPSASAFGHALDLDHPRLIVASETTVSVFDVSGAGGWVQEAELTSQLPVPPTTIHDVAIEGDIAAIAYDENWALLVHDGLQWQLVGELAFVPSRHHIEILDGSVYACWSEVGGTAASIVALDMSQGGYPDAIGPFPLPGARVVELAVGHGALSTTTFPDHSVIVSLEGADGVTRSVHHLDESLVSVGMVFSGNAAEGYGDALATDDGWIWIGAPSYDGIAVDAGRLELHIHVGAGAHSMVAAFASQEAGDRWGRSISSANGLTVFGEAEADLLSGGAGVGAVRAIRLDSTSNTWALSGETLHSWDADYTTADDFGAAVAVQSVLLPGFTEPVAALAVGEPAHSAGAGSSGLGFLAPTSALEHDQAPGLAGVAGLPEARLRGWTEAGQPLRLSLDDGAPFATAFLVLGLGSLSSPFKGGTLHPTPDLFLTVATDALGEIDLSTLWPSVPGPVQLHLQWWIQDVAAPVGFSASEGLTIRQDHS